MLSLTDIQDILRIPVLGVVPESKDVLQASNTGSPVINLRGTNVSEAYFDIVARFLGEDRPLRYITAEKRVTETHLWRKLVCHYLIFYLERKIYRVSC